MRGFAELNQVSTSAVHFVSDNEIDGDYIDSVVAEAMHKDIVIRCISYRCLNHDDFVSNLGQKLELQHSSHQESWISFLDDLITLSYNKPGLALIIENSVKGFTDLDKNIFDLIEVFLIQLHHWYNNSKPCHLYFDMSKSGNTVSTIMGL